MFSARRTTSVAVAAAALAVATTLTATGAQAAESQPKDTVWNLGYDVAATTNVKKMNRSSSTTGFSFSTVHVEKGTLSSDLMLKDLKTPVKLGGLQIGHATIAVEPVGKATGTIDATTHKVTQTQKAYLHIKDLSPAGHGLINLVGKNCKTSAPVEIPVSGTMKGGFDPITLSGNFTIPSFTGCGTGGTLNKLVTKQVSGPGNTITLKLTPRA